MKKKFMQSKDGKITYYYDEKALYAKIGKEEMKLEIFDGHYHKLKLYNNVPVLEIDGLRMQLIKDFKSPLDYAKQVVKALNIPKKSKPVILDSCMGLGYTAIEASKTADTVITCEVSDAVIHLAQWNPLSDKLFANENIVVMKGSVAELIKDFEKQMFDFVIHDPPRFSHAPELYSKDFYKQLFRVCKKGGKIFHYVGSVGAKKGRNISKEVEKRLKEAGFMNIKYHKLLQGLTAEKSV